MTCACSTSSSSTNMSKRYMRIDGLIFDKKYISKLDFNGDKLTLYRKGDCHPFCYKMWSEKSNVQIAEYLLELNTCDGAQVDLLTDDHSKLINLDLDDQHPITAIIGLNDDLTSKGIAIEEEINRAITQEENILSILNGEIQEREINDTNLSSEISSEISSREQLEEYTYSSVGEINSTLNDKLKKVYPYSVEELPSAVDNKFNFIYVEETGDLLFSNGVSWKKVLLGDL